MKNVILALLVGIVLGGLTTWSVLHTSRVGTGESHAAEGEKNGTEKEKEKEKEEKHESGVRLSPEQQTAAGILVSKPKRVEVSPETRAFGRVLDPTTLAVLWTEMITAEAAASASTREWERLKSLGENASARAYETAEAAMKRDLAMKDSAHGRLITGWGNQLASQTNLADFVQHLIRREYALARADLPAGDTLNAPPASVRFAPVVGVTAWQPAEWIGPAPSTDPQSQGEAVLILLPTQPPPPGTALTVSLGRRGSKETGFLLPSSAVVQHENGTYVFLQKSEGKFERKPVELGLAQPDGLFVKNGLSPDDQVVMTGAQQLLSEEFRAANEVE